MPNGSTKAEGFAYTALVDANGNVYSATGGGGGGASGPQPAATSQSITPATDGSAFPVVGNVASGNADSGSPVKVGAKYNLTPPTFADGQRGDLQISAGGSLKVLLANSAGAKFDSNLVGTDGGASPATVLPMAGYSLVFNGATWDRQRGDTNGGYAVSKGSGNIATAQVSVATSSTLIAAARAGRGSIKITNITGAQQIYIGNTGVTTATGDLLPAAVGASITIPANVAIYGIAATAAQTVSVMEVF